MASRQQTPPALLFVYNADGTPGAQVVDAIHKIVSPETYECSLCKLTYGAVSMHKEWKTFLDSIPLKKRFVYRNAFASEYPGLKGAALPAIVLDSGGELNVLMVGEEIGKLGTLEELINAVRRRLDNLAPASPGALS